MKQANKRPLLFVPIETKVREFHGKLLFSLCAVERGFDVIIAGQQSLQRELHTFPRGLYLDKSVAVTRKKWFRRCRAMGNAITSWDEEGLVYFDGESYLELRADKEAFDQTERFVAWGQDLKEVLVSKFPYASEKIVCCGNPRFDLLRSELRDFFQDKVDAIQHTFGKHIILINTNFGFCNHFRGLEASRKTLQTYPIARSRPDFFEGWIAAQQVMFDEFKKMIPQLSQNYPDCTIIVRPHPSENRQTWNDLTEQYPNVYVNGEGNVVEWILASRVLVHFNCTTAIEAYMMNIPAIAYKTHDIGEYEQKLPNGLSLICSDFGELNTLVGDYVAGKRKCGSSDEQNALASHFITGVDGALAADRIAETLKEVRLAGQPRRTLKQKLYTLWRTVWLQVRAVKDGKKRVDLYDQQKFPGTSCEEIEQLVKKFKEITGRFNGITVEQVSANCYRLTQAREQ